MGSSQRGAERPPSALNAVQSREGACRADAGVDESTEAGEGGSCQNQVPRRGGREGTSLEPEKRGLGGGHGSSCVSSFRRQSRNLYFTLLG